jgi:hypothetical protein
MKIVIQDREGKIMEFETLYPVEETGNGTDFKLFLCEDWILTGGKGLNEWFGYNNKTEVTNDNTLSRGA